MGNSTEQKITDALGLLGSALGDYDKGLKKSKKDMSAKDFNVATKMVKDKLKDNPEALDIFNKLKKNGFKL